jgi:methyl-accepting chemotaxis protein
MAVVTAAINAAINETSRAATQMLDASQAFSAEASTLERAVDVFLDRVTAA